MTRAKTPASPLAASSSDEPLRVGSSSFVFITQSLVNEISVRDDSLGYLGNLHTEDIAPIITRMLARDVPICAYAYADGHPQIGKWPFRDPEKQAPDVANVPARPRIAGSVPTTEKKPVDMDFIMSEFQRLTAEVELMRSRQRERDAFHDMIDHLSSPF